MLSKKPKAVHQLKIERIISKPEVSAMLQGKHLDLAYTTNLYKKYVVKMYIRLEK